MWLILFIIIIYSGFLLALFLLGIALYVSVVRTPRNVSLAAVLGVVAILAGSLNYAYIRSTDPSYQGAQQKQQDLVENQNLAEQIDFPVYTLPDSRASVVSRFGILFVLLTAPAQSDLTVYQYLPGTRPYTITQLSGGTCVGTTSCKLVGNTKLGQIYHVSEQSNRIKDAYFVSTGQTNLFLVYEKEVTDQAAIELINTLQSTPTKDLPF